LEEALAFEITKPSVNTWCLPLEDLVVSYLP
jgi:hypothetical protein